MSAFFQYMSDFVHRFRHGAERAIARELRMLERMRKIWRIVVKSQQGAKYPQLLTPR